MLYFCIQKYHGICTNHDMSEFTVPSQVSKFLRDNPFVKCPSARVYALEAVIQRGRFLPRVVAFRCLLCAFNHLQNGKDMCTFVMVTSGTNLCAQFGCILYVTSHISRMHATYQDASKTV